MRLKHEGEFENGFNWITKHDGDHAEMLMDFGILKLGRGMKFQDDYDLERVFLLIYGSVDVTWGGKTVHVERDDFLENDIWVLNLPAGVEATFEGMGDDTEIAVFRTVNSTAFEPHVYDQTNSVVEIRGKGQMNEAGTRIVRTAMDVKLSPHSNIMIGEDVHYPGKWSGFPSHHHQQPEIYYYKFMPKNGFGLIKLGDEGVLLENNDTLLIHPGKVHPQVAAPGYAMYYIWAIRHLEGNPYIKPTFEPQHLWVEEPGAKLWPEK